MDNIQNSPKNFDNKSEDRSEQTKIDYIDSQSATEEILEPRTVLKSCEIDKENQQTYTKQHNHQAYEQHSQEYDHRNQQLSPVQHTSQAQFAFSTNPQKEVEDKTQTAEGESPPYYIHKSSHSQETLAEALNESKSLATEFNLERQREEDEETSVETVGPALVAEESLLESSTYPNFKPVDPLVSKNVNFISGEENSYEKDLAQKSTEFRNYLGYTQKEGTNEELSFSSEKSAFSADDSKSVNKTGHNSFLTATEASIADSHRPYNCEDQMEFSKDYSVDSLMGSGQRDAEIMSAANVDDLADLELPPYSGSSNAGSSDEKQHTSRKTPNDSPAGESYSSSAAQVSTSTIQSFNSSGSNLAAVKDLLLFNYSKVSHVVHWKNPIETGIIFGIGCTIILALTFFSIISVFAYTGLGIIIGSSLIRAYKAITIIFNMPSETKIDNIWSMAVNAQVTMSSQKMHELVDSSLGTLNASLTYVKQVLLVEDKFATITVGLFLYMLTYIGSWFNGMTLITLTYLALFSMPIIYDKNKTKIDEYFNLISSHLSSTVSNVTSRITSLASVSGQASSSNKKRV